MTTQLRIKQRMRLLLTSIHADSKTIRKFITYCDSENLWPDIVTWPVDKVIRHFHDYAHGHNLDKRGYTGSGPSFICPGCYKRFQESQGRLAKKGAFGDPALYCPKCRKQPDILTLSDESENRVPTPHEGLPHE